MCPQFAERGPKSRSRCSGGHPARANGNIVWPGGICLLPRLKAITCNTSPSSACCSKLSPCLYGGSQTPGTVNIPDTGDGGFGVALSILEQAVAVRQHQQVSIRPGPLLWSRHLCPVASWGICQLPLHGPFQFPPSGFPSSSPSSCVRGVWGSLVPMPFDTVQLLHGHCQQL